MAMFKDLRSSFRTSGFEVFEPGVDPVFIAVMACGGGKRRSTWPSDGAGLNVKMKNASS